MSYLTGRHRTLGMNQISVVIPASDLHTSDIISALIVRIDAAFMNDPSRYEIIFPAGHSDDTLQEIKKYQETFPIRILEANAHWAHEAANETLVILHDTISSPPEALPDMLDYLHKRHLPMLVGVRKNSLPKALWNLAINCLFSVPCRYTDAELSQPGAVVLQKSTYPNLDTLDVNDTALIAKITTLSAHVPHYTVPRTQHFRSALRIGRQHTHKLTSLKSRFWHSRYLEFDDTHVAAHGNGFYYKGREYVTHNTLGRHDSAIERATLVQKLALTLLLINILIIAFLYGNTAIILLVSIVTFLYFCDLLFNLFLIYRSFKSYSEISVNDKEVAGKRAWPKYTILCPLYKEALVIPQFVSAMESIDYPKSKLEVMLLLEEDDTESIDTVESLDIPNYFQVVVVPHSQPKTKPKACNYGLQRASGDYCVIYDAEDIPDPLQLKKAVIAFEQGDSSIECIQAKLNYYNWNQNLLTRLFTLEYSLWFNLILTGLQSIKAPIPLGGTSNHFRTHTLKELGGWDPFNVTEDADLGIRLAKRGMHTAILDSTTLEEANSELSNWLKQRSRWIKGYMQTYLVHMRNPRAFSKNTSYLDMITFQLVIGGKVLSMLINPVLWVMTLSYFVFRPVLGPFIESLYLTPIFYLGAVSLIIGNFLYLYYYMMGAAKDGRPELIVYALFVPLYWLMMSFAAYYALRDLLIRPFHWHKTKHGLHLKKNREAAV